jgi:hypothetical protein
MLKRDTYIEYLGYRIYLVCYGIVFIYLPFNLRSCHSTIHSQLSCRNILSMDTGNLLGVYDCNYALKKSER